MFKALVGISICFFSLPGSISDKALIRKSGVLDLLEEEDSVMSDRGFDIEEDLLLIGACLNMPPLLSGKFQMSKEEVLGCIVSLHTQVEWATERIKNFTFLIMYMYTCFID